MKEQKVYVTFISSDGDNSDVTVRNRMAKCLYDVFWWYVYNLLKIDLPTLEMITELSLEQIKKLSSAGKIFFSVDSVIGKINAKILFKEACLKDVEVSIEHVTAIYVIQNVETTYIRVQISNPPLDFLNMLDEDLLKKIRLYRNVNQKDLEVLFKLFALKD